MMFTAILNLFPKTIQNDGSISTTFLVNDIQNVDAYVKGRMMLGKAYNFQEYIQCKLTMYPKNHD